MTAPSQRRVTSRRRLGDVLVDLGLLTEAQLDEALAAQLDAVAGGRRVRLGQQLVESGALTERDVARAMAEMLGLDVVDLGREPIDPEAVRILPRAVAERTHVLVLERTPAGLRVAAADPTNVVALDDVRVYTGAQELTVVVAPDSQIRDHLARAWSLSESSDSDLAMFHADAEDDYLEDFSAPQDAAPTVRLVNTILADAVRLRASDVHVEPQVANVRIRYRIDGLLRDVMTLPRSAAASLVSRIKIVSGLDIAERRVPQDGRARLIVDGTGIDSRVSTLPSVHGEKVVVRLLAGAESVAPLASLGFDEQQLDDLLTALTAPQGLILITGPTGSGKTNSLYAAINQIRTPDRNIVTLEDPVEIQVDGITQVQVSQRTGLTFARGLRAMLRQDPDVVLVGEVRDAETAELAMQAAMTGHLVLTTLHTNDAAASLNRLVDMGVEPFLVASSLSLVVAQRLVRRPCPSCAAPYEPSARTLAQLGLQPSDLDGATPTRGRGCGDCGDTGYRGRIGVFEVLPVTAAMRTALTRSPSENAIAEAARASGVATLRRAAIVKAMRGETTFEEVSRVTHQDALGGLTCPACARRVGDDMIVCPWCATSISRGHCTDCARPLEEDWRVCPWCRAQAPAPPVDTRPAAGRPALPRVLVVDDDPSIGSVIIAMLTDAAVVDSVGTAGEAMKLLAEHNYDAMVLDQGLPDLSGVEMVRLLRSEPSTALLPVLMFTGQDTDALENGARLAGADDFLRKPVEPALLEARLLALAARSPRFAAR